MTKKDFQLVADALGTILTGQGALGSECDAAARIMAKSLKTTNPRFDTEQFVTAVLKACYSV